jgi:hypothetical protein
MLRIFDVFTRAPFIVEERFKAWLAGRLIQDRRLVAERIEIR